MDTTADLIRKKQILLNAFVRHEIERFGGLVAEEATSPAHAEELFVSLVKETYEDAAGQLLPGQMPTDAEILVEVRAVLSAQAA